MVAVLGAGAVYWYRSQWGGSEEILGGVFRTENPLEKLYQVEWRFLGSHPLREPNNVFDMLTTEVFYLVGPTSVSVFVPLWFGLGLGESQADSRLGLLVPVDSLAAVRRFRSLLRRMKGGLLDCVIHGQLTPAVAISFLRRVYNLVQHLSLQFHCGPKIYMR